MPQRRPMRTPLIALSLLCLFACSDEERVKRPDSDATLGNLSDAEGRGLCLDLTDETEADRAYIKSQCTLTGVLRESEAVPCETLRAECLANPPPPCGEQSFTGEISCDDATVGMYLGCLAALRDDSVDYFTGVTCDTSSTDLRFLLDARLDDIEEVFADKCPELAKLCPQLASDG